jgi:cyanophycinase
LSGAILAVGGAEDKSEKSKILKRFVQAAGGRKARIAIVAAASSIPDKRAASYEEVFRRLGAAEAFPVPMANRREARSPVLAEALGSSSGVFLTGGDQSRLVSILAGSEILHALFQLHRRGGAIAGTSAAASAFSARMIAGGGSGLTLRPDAVTLRNGLGLLPELIIDQHFSQRERMGRLLCAVAREPACLGVGLDEDTGIFCHPDGEIEVIGSGHVFVIAAASESAEPGRRRPFRISGISVDVLSHGERFASSRREGLSA